MIAVDVVLLPPREVMEKAIEINRRIIDAEGNDIVLDMDKYIPHITLAMGCVEEKDLERVDFILNDIATSFRPVSMKTVPSKGGKAWIKIDKTRDIELLHEIVMIRMQKFFSYRVSTDMICHGEREEINDVTRDYIRKFPTASSFENYTPHITVGSGETAVEVGSFEFTSTELALCHLGNFCTCGKVLFSHTLSG